VLRGDRAAFVGISGGLLSRAVRRKSLSLLDFLADRRAVLCDVIRFYPTVPAAYNKVRHRIPPEGIGAAPIEGGQPASPCAARSNSGPEPVKPTSGHNVALAAVEVHRA
jgi:hypothetical protein